MSMRKAGTSGPFPPPTNMIGRGAGAPKRTGSAMLPKFSDMTGEDEAVPQAPPRSPRQTITLADLPAIPSRAPATGNAPQAEGAAPGKKRSQAELRKECITEIYQTEKDYIDDLETMISVRFALSCPSLELALFFANFGMQFRFLSFQCVPWRS